MRQSSILRIVYAALIVWLASVLPVSSATRHVVVLYDERTALPGLAAIDASIVGTLTSESSEAVQIYSEGMDLSRFGSASHIALFRDYLRAKYAGRKIDVAIAVLGPSLDFLLNHGQLVFPGAAIVFCGIDKRELTARSLPSHVTGVLLKREFSPTLELARHLQPDTQRIVVVAGTSKFDADLLAQAREELRSYEDRLAFTYLTTLPLSELLTRLAQLPPRTIVLYTTLFRDGAGEPLVPHEALERVSAAANAPVYGFLDQYLGRGIVGGSLYSLALQGKEAARLASRILAGTAPSALPVLAPVTSTVMFDWRQLRRWGIPEALLPAKSEVRFREPTVWDQYRWQIILIGTALLLQAALIGVLLHENRRRRDAEASAGKLESELAHMNRVATAGELAASIAHEIRQPLAAIVTHGGAGLLWLKKKIPDLDEVRLALQSIVSEGHRADEVIRNIRAMFSRGSTPRMLIDVNELIRQVLTLTMHKMGSSDIGLKTNFATKPAPLVRADPVQLQQVVLNLVVNAIEAMSSSAGRTRELRLRTEIDPAGAVLITIADTGPGIDPKATDSIFKPFFTTKPGGMGMGLSICKSIVESHGGRLTATPGKRGGSVFEILLPGADTDAK